MARKQKTTKLRPMPRTVSQTGRPGGDKPFRLQTLECGKVHGGGPSHLAQHGINCLLPHTSGIPGYKDTPDYQKHIRERAGAPLDFIKRFRDRPLDFTPGEKFHYDNLGYFLLGVIIEQTSGMK